MTSADGHGRKKKDATKQACAQLLGQLNYYKSSPLFLASSIYKAQKKMANPPREAKRKTIVKDKKMDPSYGHQINPVSRLIQVSEKRANNSTNNTRFRCYKPRTREARRSI